MVGPNAQLLDAAHDAGVGEMAQRLQFEWSVAAAASPWAGMAHGVRPTVHPDPDYRSKARRPHRCLREAARHLESVVALFLDEFGYRRWPEVAPTWRLEMAVAPRAGTNQQWRTNDALFPLQPVWLPTYAHWLNPIEQLWRWLRQDVLKLHRWVED